ncbi:MAG: hypothetical protein GKR89_20160 [Candidatus Latescibacteria bacterium]|nr:hypothetical protein [Candidatus Latescibacterota bacterium]
MVVNNEIQSLLVDLGLTVYEARAYLALMRCQPATAYELAKQSGIPSSKIYETVNRLLEKELAQPVGQDQGRGQRYYALDPDDFVYAKRQETLQKTERLGPLLAQTSNRASADVVWRLGAADKVYDKARQLLRQAQDSVLISLWPEELQALETELLDAEKRGLRLALVHFGEPAQRIGATFHHPVEETIYQEKGGRGLTLVSDSEAVVMATFFDDGRVEGAWSRNSAVVTVAEGYVQHDVYITKVTATMERELKSHFGKYYQRLRDVFEPVE